MVIVYKFWIVFREVASALSGIFWDLLKFVFVKKNFKSFIFFEKISLFTFIYYINYLFVRCCLFELQSVYGAIARSWPNRIIVNSKIQIKKLKNMHDVICAYLSKAEIDNFINFNFSAVSCSNCKFYTIS